MTFNVYSSQTIKIALLFLLFVWVYQSPLKRGVVSCLGIWGVLFFSYDHFLMSENQVTLTNFNNYLVLASEDEVLLSSAWSGGGASSLLLNKHLNLKKTKGILLDSPKEEISPYNLLKYDVAWVITAHDVTKLQKTMLEALQVSWVKIPLNGRLLFHFDDNMFWLRHSSCAYSFLLLQSDTCRRVEKLESVLNYLQT